MSRLALLVLVTLAMSGCYMQDREAYRPAPKPVDVMADLQDVADTHPLADMSR